MPSEIGGYQIQRVLGSGGMATVYAALQKQPRRTVALKVMRSTLAASNSDSALRRFKREIEILGRLHHPGIAQVYAAGTHDDGGGPMPFFVMEYISNARTILEHIASKDLPLRERLKLFVKVCAAVDHGHRNKIIHRDLKPGNILIDEFGEPKIIDFGIAHAAELDVTSQTMHAEAGRIVGTLQYMSPEQLDTTAQDLDARCDVYALGVLLYKMLTGKSPHDLEALPVYEAVRIIREESPRHPSDVKAEIRGDLETIILKAMDPDRTRRYTNAGSLGRDLVRYLAHQPIHGRRAGMLHRSRLFFKRHRTGMVVSAIVIAIAGGAAALVIMERSRLHGDHAAREKILDRDREALQRQTELLRQSTAAADAQRQNAIKPVAAPYTLRVHSSRTTRLLFLPGANHLASASMDHTLVIWDLQTRVPQFTIAQFDAPVIHLAASADGALLAAASDKAPIQIIDASTGAVVQSIRRISGSIAALAMSPSGDRLAIALDDLTIRIIIRQSPGEAGERILRGSTGAFGPLAFSQDGSVLAAGSAGGSAYTWRVNDARLIGREELSRGAFVLVAVIHPTDRGETLLSVMRDGTAFMSAVDLDDRTRKSDVPPVRFTLTPRLIRDASLDPAGKWLACAADDAVTIWKLDQNPPWNSEQHRITLVDRASAVAVDPLGSWCAVGLPEGDIAMHPVAKETPPATQP